MRPLLLDFQVKRIKETEEEKPFYYNQKLNLNVELVNGIEIPFIESSEKQAEFLSKTFTERERDDQDDDQKIGINSKILKQTEVMTITRAEREQDDQNKVFNKLETHRELMTKTEAERERDDIQESFGIKRTKYAELMTKTATERERDDMR